MSPGGVCGQETRGLVNDFPACQGEDRCQRTPEGRDPLQGRHPVRHSGQGSSCCFRYTLQAARIVARLHGTSTWRASSGIDCVLRGGLNGVADSSVEEGIVGNPPVATDSGTAESIAGWRPR